MKYQEDEEISVKELIQKARSLWVYFFQRRLFILLASFFGAALGFCIAWKSPSKYVSKITFVAEETKTIGGGLASLAGQFGLDLGGASGGGVFSADNLPLFLKSEDLIRETLLTTYDSSGAITLADQYAVVYMYKKKWARNDEIGPISFFAYRDTILPRKEDSLLQVVIKSITKELTVVRPEKKASFLEVVIKTRDELLSKLFVDRLVSIGTDRYVQSKIKIKAANVSLLQKRADSIGLLLNNTTYKAAESQQVLVDLNPALRT
ncbi:MAG: hypothetical protein ACK487_01305, partial [Sphingomonadales bacterium]